MTTVMLGKTFPKNSPWHHDENTLIENIMFQIDRHFTDGKNLLVNLTYFGPQFDKNEFDQLQNYVGYNRIFFLASVDPPMLNAENLQKICCDLEVDESYYLGNFDSLHQFTFIATLLPGYFEKYHNTDLIITQPNYVFLNYNRKPRQHRIDLINLLTQKGLDKIGLISLGAPDQTYGVSNTPLLIDKNPKYDSQGNRSIDDRYGIVNDIHSLGNLSIWQQHFLNLVSETEFLPWDPMFISEKIWKPILGLRPFVINGQTKIYQYLRDNGFKTFNHYWPHVQLEQVNELEVHASIVEVIKYLATMNRNDILSLYQDMLPDLLHNQSRFFEFAQEQKFKMENLFK